MKLNVREMGFSSNISVAALWWLPTWDDRTADTTWLLLKREQNELNHIQPTNKSTVVGNSNPSCTHFCPSTAVGRKLSKFWKITCAIGTVPKSETFLAGSMTLNVHSQMDIFTICSYSSPSLSEPIFSSSTCDGMLICAVLTRWVKFTKSSSIGNTSLPIDETSMLAAPNCFALITA